LTGLFNRSGFDECVQQQLMALQQKATNPIKPVYAYLDLDQFKLINDTVGHNAGDVYLRQLAGWLEDWLPKGAFVGRLGGDEFGLWLLDHRWAQTQLQTLIDLIRERRFVWEGQPFQVGASVGLVEVNRSDMPLMWLYQAADTACYTAKSLGRDRLHWYKEDDVDVQGHQRDVIALNQVRSALGKGPERFELWAQTLAAIHPDVDDGQLHYEVLIRLRDANNDIVNPGVFLPAAERYGELLRLDTWVLWNYLEQACSSPEHLERLGFVDINVTGAALVHPDFRATIKTALDTFDFPWHKLTLEVTETTAVRNFEQARSLIEFCKSKGIRFALDDFGSGMASFDYLKRLPFDIIKIDGSFITSIVDDPMDETMVNFMVKLANLRGQLTVAEFVENEAIVERLKANGVHYAQGYHFGRPKPFSEWLSG
ncbi:MAG: EAL domain-containing protein, partial [Gammaproteobacteria bacterium]|nr:EAL domain-containing protein [Gammaproteobacteria bacterium]